MEDIIEELKNDVRDLKKNVDYLLKCKQIANMAAKCKEDAEDENKKNRRSSIVIKRPTVDMNELKKRMPKRIEDGKTKRKRKSRY